VSIIGRTGKGNTFIVVYFLDKFGNDIYSFDILGKLESHRRVIQQR
jgi:hypothetical protein